MARKLSFVLSLTLLFALAISSAPPSASAALQDVAAAKPSRSIGAIKAIIGSTITLTPDSGSEIAVNVDSTAHILRIAPGETNLKNATPVQLQDLQVGDRILVGGKLSDDGKSLAASTVVVMKRADVQAKQEKERDDWQKRGLGGIVGAVNPAAGVVTISVTGFGGAKTIMIRTSSSTIIRRYAPDSVKFNDARASSIQEIRSGDQLRARGNRSADGGELTADEIVTGSFRNVAGLVNSVDVTSGVVNVQDLMSKKPVQIKVSGDSQLHQLPPEMAQRIAMRLKSSMLGGTAGVSGAAGGAVSSTAPTNSPQIPSGGAKPPLSAGTPGGAGGMRGGAPDFNQILNRMPTVNLADLHKGDAVLIVATEGDANSPSTAITLLSGVEPILRAAPSPSQAMMLTPWSLGGPGGDLAGQ